MWLTDVIRTFRNSLGESLKRLGDWVSVKEDRLPEPTGVGFFHNDWFLDRDFIRDVRVESTEVPVRNRERQWLRRAQFIEGSAKMEGLE